MMVVFPLEGFFVSHPGLKKHLHFFFGRSIFETWSLCQNAMIQIAVAHQMQQVSKTCCWQHQGKMQTLLGFEDLIDFGVNLLSQHMPLRLTLCTYEEEFRPHSGVQFLLVLPSPHQKYGKRRIIFLPAK